MSLVVLLITANVVRAQLPDLKVPDSLGVNIHFTDPQPGELEMLAAGGFKWIRMDFDWARIETKKGQYDFSPYDRLLGALDKHKIRAIFILDYANPLYDNNHSPETDAGRSGFANWAIAAVRHFRHRGVLWEMYNEPNITPFWRPNGPNVDNYIKLARAVGEGIKRAAPDELYIGPASSTLDFPFLEACFKAGLLNYSDAVSVHPYGQDIPESRADGYRKLRLMIEKYKPAKKVIPIISGEWGYSTTWSGMSPDLQAKMLARQWLFNLSQQIPVSIWYDWHDDGPDPKEPEHHFGTVLHEYHKGRTPVYDAKPSYLAARALTQSLGGFVFNKRLATQDPHDFVLLFDRGDEVRLVAWTTLLAAHDATITASPGNFSVTSMTGEKLPAVAATERGLTAKLTDAPQYIVPDHPNGLLRAAASWKRAPLEILASRKQLLDDVGVEINLPMQLPGDVMSWRIESRSIESPTSITYGRYFRTSAMAAIQTLRLGQDLCGASGSQRTLRQETALVLTDPLGVTFHPRSGRLLPIGVENPGGTAFNGTVLVSIGGTTMVDPLEIKQGQMHMTLMRAVPPRKSGDDVVSLELRDHLNRRVLSTGETRLRPLDLTVDQLQLSSGGDANVNSEQTMTAPSATELPAGLPVPVEQAIKIAYRFDVGWRYICLRPKGDDRKIDRSPASLCFWLYSDGSGNIPRMRFTDSTGQTFQPDAPAMRSVGWQYITFHLNGVDAGHWGGKADGIAHPPIALDTLLLIDNATRQKTSGEIFIATPVLIYAAE